MDAPDYDTDSPAAWDIRVQRGADLLDRITGNHDWRLLVDLDARDIRDLLDQLCAQGLTGVCRDTVALHLNSTQPFGFGFQMDDHGFDCGTDELDELAAAWARCLEPFLASVRVLAA